MREIAGTHRYAGPHAHPPGPSRPLPADQASGRPGRLRRLRSRPAGPGLAALRGAAVRAAAVSGPRPPSSGRPGVAWPIGMGSPPAQAGRPAPRGPPLRRRRARSPAASARRGLGPRAGWSWRPVSALPVRLVAGRPVRPPPVRLALSVPPRGPQAAPYRAARLRHGRPPGLPPPGAGAAAASGRPGQSQRPGEGGLVLVLPGCCCGPGGPCCPAAWPLGTEARRPGLRSRVQTSGRQRPPLTSARPPGSG